MGAYQEFCAELFPGGQKEVGLLTDLFNEITGCTAEPYVMGGGTHARKLLQCVWLWHRIHA